MKIIHTADIHLGSKINAKFPKKISEERKKQLRKTLEDLIFFAESNEVKAIILAGDVFDNDKPSIKDKEYFYGLVKNYPNIDFIYLKGNHDKDNNYQLSLPNLKEFSNTWQEYRYDNIVIKGIEIDEENQASLYSTLSLNENDLNIVTLHGQVGSAASDINITKLRNKNIDYLALGHIHKYQESIIDERGKWVYSGCLEPRGFDEIGEKGFVLLETCNQKINYTFVSFSKKTIHEHMVDISGLSDQISISKRITDNVSFNSNDIYRINLVGETEADIIDFMEDIKEILKNKAYFIDIKNKTTEIFDYNKYANDISLKGQFVRNVFNNQNYTNEEKIKIVKLGIKALEGKDVE